VRLAEAGTQGRFPDQSTQMPASSNGTPASEVVGGCRGRRRRVSTWIESEERGVVM